MLIAVDFDDTIASKKMKPIKGALKGIKELIEAGHEIYILTARQPAEWPEVYKWLKDKGFPQMEVGNTKKLHTRAIIDDRAIRFENNWSSIKKYFI